MGGLHSSAGDAPVVVRWRSHAGRVLHPAVIAAYRATLKPWSTVVYAVPDGPPETQFDLGILARDMRRAVGHEVRMSESRQPVTPRAPDWTEWTSENAGTTPELPNYGVELPFAPWFDQRIRGFGDVLPAKWFPADENRAMSAANVAIATSATEIITGRRLADHVKASHVGLRIDATAAPEGRAVDVAARVYDPAAIEAARPLLDARTHPLSHLRKQAATHAGLRQWKQAPSPAPDVLQPMQVLSVATVIPPSGRGHRHLVIDQLVPPSPRDRLVSLFAPSGRSEVRTMVLALLDGSMTFCGNPYTRRVHGETDRELCRYCVYMTTEVLSQLLLEFGLIRDDELHRPVLRVGTSLLSLGELTGGSWQTSYREVLVTPVVAALAQ